LKCTKIDFGWGSDPAGGAYSAPPDPVAGFKGTYTSKRREGRRKEGTGEGRGVIGEEGECREGGEGN